MKNKCLLALLGCAAFVPAIANDFPTTDRVEFVLECLYRHKDVPQYEMIYKCSCSVDKIAEKYKYDDYVTASTAARDQGVQGEIGGLFRDPADIKKMAKEYNQIKAESEKACFFPTK